MRLGFVTRAAALAAALLVSAHAAAADAARGRSLAAPCAACPGADGNPTMPLVPSLAGQPAVFLTLQMILFREGIRAVPAMTAAMQGISDRDVEDLAAHYAAGPPRPEPAAREATKAERGAALSARHRCGLCHLPDYTGQNQVPRLAGQREDFLLATMQDYQGQRRTGTDTTMNAALHGLPAQDLADLAHHLAIRP